MAAEREIAEARPEGRLTAEQIRQLVEGLEDIPKVLADADPKVKAKVYADVGIKITYEPARRVVIAEARPACTTERVGGAST